MATFVSRSRAMMTTSVCIIPVFLMNVDSLSTRSRSRLYLTAAFPQSRLTLTLRSLAFILQAEDMSTILCCDKYRNQGWN